MKLSEAKEMDHRGWNVLINCLINTIETILKNANYDLEDKNKLKVEVDQIKEKYGGLRFYYHTYCDESIEPEEGPERNRIGSWDGYFHMIEGAVWMAEDMSTNICEYCGNPGKLRPDGWWKTRCDRCEEEQKVRL